MSARPDRGSLGPAQRRRPGEVVTIALPVEVAPGTTRLQRAEVLRYGDCHVIDRMAHAGQLCDRQHANAAALLQLWRAAGLEPRTTADLSDTRHGRGMERDPEELAAEDIFHDEMRRFRGQVAAILMDLLRDRHPGVRWLATLQAALDRLDHLPARWGGELWAAEE